MDLQQNLALALVLTPDEGPVVVALRPGVTVRRVAMAMQAKPLN